MSEDDDLDLSAWTVPPPPDDLAERAALRALAPPPVVAREMIAPRRSGLRTALLVFGASMGGAAIASAFWARLYFDRPSPVPAPTPEAVIAPMRPMDHAAEVTPILAPVAKVDPCPATPALPIVIVPPA